MSTIRTFPGMRYAFMTLIDSLEMIFIEYRVVKAILTVSL